MADQLPILYQKIAELTSPSCQNGTAECARFCDRKYRCCEAKYCDLAARFAREKYGIELQPTGHPDLPFMGENGCVVPVHLRPVCSIHVCSWAWCETTRTCGDRLAEYEQLREQILTEAKAQGKEPW